MGQAEYEFGMFEGDCLGCEVFGRVSDLGLCEDCSGKLERDLIRERDWPRSVTAYAMNEQQREELRRKVIRKFGKNLELIAPSRPSRPKRNRRKRRRRK